MGWTSCNSDEAENADESPQTECEGNVEFDSEKDERSSMRRFWDLTARAFTAVKDRSKNEKNASAND